MKKRMILYLVLIVMPLQARDILDSFRQMPEQLNLQLNYTLRLELLDNYFQGIDSIENLYKGYTHVEKLNLSRNLLELRSTRSSALSLKYFINGTDTIIGVIFTAFAPLGDSELFFYNVDWKPLEVRFQKSSARVFMPKATSDDLKMFESWAYPNLVVYQFSDEKEQIVSIFETVKYLDAEQCRKMKVGAKTPRVPYRLERTTDGYEIVPDVAQSVKN